MHNSRTTEKNRSKSLATDVWVWNVVFHLETSFYTLKLCLSPSTKDTDRTWEEAAEGNFRTTPWDFQNIQPSPYFKEVTRSVGITTRLRTGRSEVRILAPIRDFFFSKTGFLSWSYGMKLTTQLDLATLLTHCGRVTQICVFNTVKLGTSASSP